MSSNPPQDDGSSRTVRVVGDVEFRPGDGPKMQIRKGPVEVEVTGTDAVLSWVDGETHGSATLPLNEYRRYVAEGAIATSGPV